ncbi:MAG TPA: glycosyl hydrolase [Saprospiraceae bacterium]|nr:glycosyl hydrolase [Saprospiraceae bacterium]
MKNILTACLLAGVAAFGSAQTMDVKEGKSDLDLYFKTVKWRCIGPFRGGRSNGSTGVPGDPLTYYMGTTGGGLWKTEDAGQLWQNVSDGYFKTASVGAVAVAASNPNIVYVGMGEHAVRGVMTSYGDGVYKSIDAGKTWQHMGLEKTEHIARVRIHPDNPDIVYVAAQGQLHGSNKDRGVFKSTDGGKTWTNVLFVNDQTGCVELSMDAHNPEVLYAAMWEHERLPWQVVSGGTGDGLYKSTDGGAHWDKIQEGLPKALGKMAVAVSPANSNRVYAVIESDTGDDKNGGLFVSTNAGKSWSRVSDDHRLTQRAWYYIEVFPDPQDEYTVYVMSAPALRSIDGGKTWETLGGTHGDFHDLWINPDNPKNMVISNDGGAAISFNRGASWSTQDNMPTAQFYRINTDNLFPYNIYGGQQDNTSVKIASRNFGWDGINQRVWSYSAGGESAFLAFDPDDPKAVMGGSYLGSIEVIYPDANAGTNIMAAPIQYLGRETRDMKYRFNWNAPIIWSQHEPNTFYHGAQMVLRTRDFGKTWDEASPDLTRNEKEKQGKGGAPYTNEAVGAENYGTLSYIMESPQEAGVIYTGSDDGMVYLTRDGCAHWQNVTPQGLKECLINAIEVSPHDPATAYIATTRYKLNDHTPGIYKTTNYGKTWTNISSGIPYGAYTRVVREDPVRKDLLYAGTETGIYISWNGGKDWKPMQLNLPVTPITDLKFSHGNLIAATMGRSFWILDDMSLFQQYEDHADQTLIYHPADAYLTNGYSPLNQTSEDFTGLDQLEGINPANGVVVYYQLPEDSLDISLKFKDKNGKTIHAYTSGYKGFRPWDGGPRPDPAPTANKGLNRFVWNMRYPTMPGVQDVYVESSYAGHKAIPGSYEVVLTVNGTAYKSGFTILKNPKYPTDNAMYMTYDSVMTYMESQVTEMHNMINTLNNLQNQLSGAIKDIPERADQGALKKEGEDLIQKIKDWDEAMVQRKSKAYDDVDNYENKFTANYLFVLNHTESDIPVVTQPDRDRMHELDLQWMALRKQGNELLDKEIPAFNRKLWEAGVGALRADKKD